MVENGRTSLMLLVAALATAPACDVVDRARARLGTGDDAATVATGGGLALGLHGPGVLRPGDQGVLGLSVTNRTDSAVTNIRLELIVPGWIEPIPPRYGDREVSMTALEDGGTRFAFVLGEPLAPNETQTVEQRIRVPVARSLNDGLPVSRNVRGRLLGSSDSPLAEVESEIVLDAVGWEGGEGAGAVGADTAAAPRDRLGAARLGMTSAQLRQAVPSTRDTSWSQEGTTERGLVVPLEGGQRAVAVLSGDTVSRLVVSDPATQTRERLGVGSRLGELRDAYGRPCADIGEGTVVVWFPTAPGMSFALDSPPPQNPEQLRRDPRSVPDSARVTRWWIRRGVDTCPE